MRHASAAVVLHLQQVDLTPPPPLSLCYHGVGDVSVRVDRSRLFVAPGRLRQQVRLLRRWGYRFVTFGQLASRIRGGEAAGCCALTFDDGFVDSLTVLSPLLAELELPATVFVVSGWRGERHPDAPWTRTLTPEEVRQLSRTGIEIGGHSTSHAHLPDLSPQAAEADMRGCRLALEELTDRPVEVFAYPYGGADAATRSACRAAGYSAACRSAGAGSWSDPFDLPRQDMQNGSSLAGLWLKREARYEALAQTAVGLRIRQLRRVIAAVHR